MSYAVAIDGPAGAGKSTIAKRVAAKLSAIYVDTGAMYRAMALFMLRKGLTPADTEQFGICCKDAEISLGFVKQADGSVMQQVLLGDEVVDGYIRTEEVGNMASVCAANSEVRKKLVELQQKIAENLTVVMDGRDIGTHVLPNAEVKIYLTASSRVRAVRRFQELQEKGADANLEQIEHDIIERDERDMNRAISPLRQAEDAILLDSSDLSIEQVEAEILRIVDSKVSNR